MARKRYIKSHSNYVMKSFHQATDKGNIYERDFMTISQVDMYVPGQVPIYRTGNFRMTVRNEASRKKKHKYGTWLENENANSISGCSGDTTVWSLGCMQQSGDTTNTSSDSNSITPDYTSIRDFVCYGSAVDFLLSEIRGILENFPGEMYFSDKLVFSDEDGEMYYEIENPFNLTFFSNHDTWKNIYRNPDSYRYIPPTVMDTDSSNYKDIDEEITYQELGEVHHTILDDGCSISTRLIRKINVCGEYIYYAYVSGTTRDYILAEREDVINGLADKVGDMMIRERKHGKYMYLYNRTPKDNYYKDLAGARIRPSYDIIDSFFENLNPFQKKLLDRDTNYETELVVIKEGSDGVFEKYTETFKWPVRNGWNIENGSETEEEPSHTGKFKNRGPYYTYMTKLFEMAYTYDEYWTNNIYRSMTHEAIITLDNSFTKEFVGENDILSYELTEPKSTRIADYLKLCGRVFDFLKLYIDGIKYAAASSYKSTNSVSDYLLTDMLTLNGWDVENLLEELPQKVMSDPLYQGETRGYSINDANTAFFRRLLTNSSYIMSLKGTKMGIEAMLALFGFRSEDFLHRSFYYSYGTRGDIIGTTTWNGLDDAYKSYLLKSSYKMSEYVYVANDKSTTISEDNVDFVKEFCTGYAEGVDGEVYQYLNADIRYYYDNYGIEHGFLIPWMGNDDERPNSSTNYFEAKGGWGLSHKLITDFDEYGNYDIETDEFDFYRDTQKALRFVDTVEELKYVTDSDIQNGDIYYVEDLNDIDKYTPIKDENISITYTTYGGSDTDGMKLRTINTKGIFSLTFYFGPGKNDWLRVNGADNWDGSTTSYTFKDSEGNETSKLFYKLRRENEHDMYKKSSDETYQGYVVDVSDEMSIEYIELFGYGDNSMESQIFVLDDYLYLDTCESVTGTVESYGTIKGFTYAELASRSTFEESGYTQEESYVRIFVKDFDIEKKSSIKFYLSNADANVNIRVKMHNKTEDVSHYFTVYDNDYIDEIGSGYYSITSSGDIMTHYVSNVKAKEKVNPLDLDSLEYEFEIVATDDVKNFMSEYSYLCNTKTEFVQYEGANGENGYLGFSDYDSRTVTLSLFNYLIDGEENGYTSENLLEYLTTNTNGPQIKINVLDDLFQIYGVSYADTNKFYLYISSKDDNAMAISSMPDLYFYENGTNDNEEESEEEIPEMVLDFDDGYEYYIQVETSSGYTYEKITDVDTAFDIINNGSTIYIRHQGWRVLTESELEEASTLDAIRTIYVESVIEKNTGNNPHVGNLRYDYGNTYASLYENLFKDASLDDYSDEVIPWIDDYGKVDESKYIGFNLDLIEDNSKTWYFYDESVDINATGDGGNIARPYVVTETIEMDKTKGANLDGLVCTKDITGNDYDWDTYSSAITITRTVNTNSNAWATFGDAYMISNVSEIDGGYDDLALTNLENARTNSGLEAYDLRTGKKYSGGDGIGEVYSYSIINSKKFHIDFNPNVFISGVSLYSFLNKKVMNYLTQMIPSTTLFSYNIPETDLGTVIVSDVAEFDKKTMPGTILNTYKETVKVSD